MRSDRFPEIESNKINKGKKKKRNKIPLKSEYFIKENRDMVIKSNEFDQIYFLLENENCEMHKKIQHKLKKTLYLEKTDRSNNFYSIDKFRSIILVQSFWRTDRMTERIKATVNLILELCLDSGYEKIAINIDFKDPVCYFEFKSILREYFSDFSEIQVTLYLNKVIEVLDPEVIKRILRMYHDTVLKETKGGRAATHINGEECNEIF